MSKFLKLIGNEWKKQFAKVATWIILALLLLSTLAFAFFTNAADRIFDSFYSEDRAWESELEYNRQYMDEKDSLGNYTDYALDCRTWVVFYEYLINNHISPSDWRYQSGLIYEMAYARVRGTEEEYQTLASIVSSGNLDSYYQIALQDLIKADPENEEIYRWSTSYAAENRILPADAADWRYTALKEAERAKISIAEQESLKASGSVLYSEDTHATAKEKELIALYRLEHNQKVNPADAFKMNGSTESRFWQGMLSSVSLMNLVGLISIVIGGSIVANEFSTGTIKFLLINPVKRWKILMAKYVTTLLFGVMATAGVFLISFLLSLVAGGAGEAFLPALSVKGGVVVKSSPYLRLIGQYLLSSVKVVVMTTLAFAISSLVHSSALAIGLSMFAFLAGNLIVTILQLMNLDFARYLIFANMDFAAIVNKTTGFVHHSLPLAIVIVALHMVVFLWTAWDGFVRREV